MLPIPTLGYITCTPSITILPDLYCGINVNSITSLDSIGQLITNLITIALTVAGIAAVFMVIYGGILYISSQGDPGNTKKARDTIVNWAIGLVIIASAYLIVGFVAGKLGA